MQEAYTPGRNITDHLYEVCCDAIKGRPFGDIISLPKKDARFTYGAAKGDDGLVDINYMSILVSVRSDEDGNAEVLNEYEVYDTNGGFVEYRRYMQPFLDFCGYLMEGSGYYKYNGLIVSAQEKVDDNDEYEAETMELHDSTIVDYNEEAMRVVDDTDRALLIEDRADVSDVELDDALAYAKDAYAEYVRFMSDDNRKKGVEIKFSEDGARTAYTDGRSKRGAFPKDMGWPYRMVYAVPVTKTYSVEFVSLEKAEEFRDKFAWALKDFQGDIFGIE